ncbi:ATP-binding protein [Peribacillus butanolivorans]|uniref:ATP-binding protein n=1 Tax=Peribacillus butanolivorans TaxID=421767 RepID=A0AAX0S5W4_9BACI|nr:ATP-binding protein [Peribacillus butanolivorans]PEJ34214.1 ATP-binding protein [Peribacillus butanolivorans]
MKIDIVDPVVGNFVKSLRDIGYTFEVAVADILDNSIAAKAETIKILCLPAPNMIFATLDDGLGMNESELVEAMRLAANDPDTVREPNDLGKFGLGLKTASFSQCKKLTVLSKKDGKVSVKQWDLEYISNENKWFLKTLDMTECENYPFVDSLLEQERGTLVIWEDIDSFNSEDIPSNLSDLRNHLSLVFHYFLDGKVPGRNKINIFVNEVKIDPFNPFNPNHRATQEFHGEKIRFKNSEVLVQPYILPHHSKLSPQEYERYATTEGYTKSQGFYLYREHRLLIHGTWWGMHKMNDAHRLVRIKIEISNTQDADWGIDIKKSTARPVRELRKDLQRIIQQVTVKGSRPFVGRGRRIEDTTTTNFWDCHVKEGSVRFVINKKHPVLNKLNENLTDEQQELLKIYLSSLEGFLPLDTIVAQLHTNPHKVNQEPEISNEELIALVEKWRNSGVSEEFIQSLIKTEIFKGKREFLINEN